MEIRTMTINDYKEVSKLWSNTAGMGMRSLDDSEAGIAKFLKRNSTTNFVAIRENQVVGVILGGHDGRRGYIYHTAVDIEYRGNGIGSKMVETVVIAFENEGINKAALVVFKTNDTGNQFWKSMGWEERLDLNYYNLSINHENI
ncbi:MAG TPA: GNAT family N-acetyltransferase [Ruminiclostridium sp.]